MSLPREAITLTTVVALATAVGLTFLAMHPGSDMTLPRAGSVTSNDNSHQSDRNYSTVEFSRR